MWRRHQSSGDTGDGVFLIMALMGDKAVKWHQSLPTATTKVTEVQFNQALFLLWSPFFALNSVPLFIPLGVVNAIITKTYLGS